MINRTSFHAFIFFIANQRFGDGLRLNFFAMKRVMSFVLYVLIASWLMPAYCYVTDFDFYGEHYRLDDVSGLAFRLCDGIRMATVVSPDRLPDLSKACRILNDSVAINNKRLEDSYHSCGVLWQSRLRSLGPESAAYMVARQAYSDGQGVLAGKIRTLISSIDSIIAGGGTRTAVAGRSNLE